MGVASLLNGEGVAEVVIFLAGSDTRNPDAEFVAGDVGVPPLQVGSVEELGSDMSERKIDIYNHVMPCAVADRIHELAPGKGDMVKRVTGIPMLYDIEARVRMMEQWPGYQQVLTLSNPPIETIAGPGDSPELARVANEELRKICEARPDKFPAWVAALPLNNVNAALEEMDRAIASGACGIQIFTNIAGRPPDDPEFLVIFNHATNRHKIPIWMHPARDARVADYPGETKSKYEIWQVLGWPYETSVAMAHRLFRNAR